MITHIQVGTTPFKKKRNTTLIDYINFLWICIHHVRYIIWKLGYSSFHWYMYFICHDCFAGKCTGRLNCVQCKKHKFCKNWTTTLIDDTNLFMRLYSSCYILKACFICLSICILFVMIAWQKRAQGDYIRRNVNNECSKIVPLFEIQHDVLFRRISVGFRYNEWAAGYMCLRSQNMT